jgi:hypothetical protein
MVSTHIIILVAAIAVATSAVAQGPKELRDARRQFESLKHPRETDRVRYITRLARLRESFTRADYKIMEAIDAEVIRHPMPAAPDTPILVKRLIGRWQSPRHPYFYHADGTWASDDNTAEDTGGTWRIEGNKFFQNYRGDTRASGEVIILLTSTDLIFGTHVAPYYLRKGKVLPWR